MSDGDSLENVSSAFTNSSIILKPQNSQATLIRRRSAQKYCSDFRRSERWDSIQTEAEAVGDKISQKQLHFQVTPKTSKDDMRHQATNRRLPRDDVMFPPNLSPVSHDVLDPTLTHYHKKTVNASAGNRPNLSTLQRRSKISSSISRHSCQPPNRPTQIISESTHRMALPQRKSRSNRGLFSSDEDLSERNALPSSQDVDSRASFSSFRPISYSSTRGQALYNKSLDTPTIGQLSEEFPYSELVAATNCFHPARRLGGGATGAVYGGTLRRGTDIAVKVLEEFDANGFEEEIRVLSRCRHPNLVTLLGWSRQKARRFIVYEFLTGGDLCRKLDGTLSQRSCFSWDMRLRAAQQTCQAVAYIHGCAPKVFHRDIKAANVLLDEHGTAKLADFGLACVADRATGISAVEKAEGTAGYADPEYIRTLEFNEAREVYSLGMLFLELITSRPPAAYVAKENGSEELCYLIHDISSVNSAIQLVDESARMPLGIAERWIRLSLRWVVSIWFPAVFTDLLRCIGTAEPSRPSALQLAAALKELLEQGHQSYPSMTPSKQWGVEVDKENILSAQMRSNTHFSKYEPRTFSKKPTQFSVATSFYSANERIENSPGRRRPKALAPQNKHLPKSNRVLCLDAMKDISVRAPLINLCGIPKADLLSSEGSSESSPQSRRDISPLERATSVERIPSCLSPSPTDQGDEAFLYRFRVVGSSVSSSSQWWIPGSSLKETGIYNINDKPVLQYLAERQKKGYVLQHREIILRCDNVMFGRKRQPFVSRLKYCVSSAALACISRNHFSIILNLVVQVSAQGFLSDLELEFNFTNHSANGGGVNYSLAPCTEQSLKDGDVIHMFSIMPNNEVHINNKAALFSAAQQQALDDSSLRLQFVIHPKVVERLKRLVTSSYLVKLC